MAAPHYRLTKGSDLTATENDETTFYFDTNKADKTDVRFAGIVLSGEGAPSDSDGADGNFYVDTEAPAMYGPKASGAWPEAPFLTEPTTTEAGLAVLAAADYAAIRSLLNVGNGAAANLDAAATVALVNDAGGVALASLVDLDTDTAGALYETAMLAREDTEREAFFHGMIDDIVGDDEILQKTADGLVGIAFTEFPAADPSDQAAGTSAALTNTIASAHFWRMRQTASIADASPFNIRLIGTSTTPGTANHTGNVLISDVDAACPWQVQDIADGLEDAEFQVTFKNAGASARNCFPQNHATSGASIQYADGVVEGDLVLPAGVGSRLVVFYAILTVGATGLIEITGQRKYTA